MHTNNSQSSSRQTKETANQNIDKWKRKSQTSDRQVKPTNQKATNWDNQANLITDFTKPFE